MEQEMSSPTFLYHGPEELNCESPTFDWSSHSHSRICSCSTTTSNFGGASDTSSECRSRSRSNSRSIFDREQTLIFFDWDDTLFPTTWLTKFGYVNANKRGKLNPKIPRGEIDAEMELLVAEVRETLSQAERYGTVVIVTNGTDGWIAESCKRFMSSMLPQVLALRSLSAKSMYQSVNDSLPEDWKMEAFRHEICRHAQFQQQKLLDSHSQCQSAMSHRPVDWSHKSLYPLNVISIGDSPYERTAILRIAATMPQDYVKSLQLMKAPDVQTLIAQHRAVRECLFLFVHYNNNWTDLKFVKS